MLYNHINNIIIIYIIYIIICYIIPRTDLYGKCQTVENVIRKGKSKQNEKNKQERVKLNQETFIHSANHSVTVVLVTVIYIMAIPRCLRLQRLGMFHE
jgi:short subunit fatty acids transporter